MDFVPQFQQAVKLDKRRVDPAELRAWQPSGLRLTSYETILQTKCQNAPPLRNTGTTDHEVARGPFASIDDYGSVSFLELRDKFNAAVRGRLTIIRRVDAPVGI